MTDVDDTPPQPRNARGQFLPGYIKWTRLWYDGAVRWVYYPEQGPDDLADVRWLADPWNRALAWILVFVVVALILYIKGWA